MQRTKNMSVMKDYRKSLSMFSKETLDSLEMAEVFGGDDNTECRNEKCTNKENCTDSVCNNSSCSNVLCSATTKDNKDSTQRQNADNCTDASCEYNSVCSCSKNNEHLTPTNSVFCLQSDDE